MSAIFDSSKSHLTLYNLKALALVDEVDEQKVSKLSFAKKKLFESQNRWFGTY